MATEQSNSSAPKLPLFSAPPAMTKYYSPQHSGILTPPLNTLASVPFKWEAQPGKPKPCTELIISVFNDNQPKCLEPPPARLYYLENTKMPSPTTVLNGPYNNNKCTSLERGQLGTLVLYNKNKNKVRKSRGYWWQWFVKRKGTAGNIRKETGGVGRGSFVFSSSSVDSTGSDESGHNPSVKMATLKRNARSHSHILDNLMHKALRINRVARRIAPKRGDVRQPTLMRTLGLLSRLEPVTYKLHKDNYTITPRTPSI